MCGSRIKIGPSDVLVPRLRGSKARLLPTAFVVKLAEAKITVEAPFRWFKETGQEVGAPQDHNVELLPEKYRAYRETFARDVPFNYN